MSAHARGARRWRLANRLRIWFGLTATGLALAIGLASVAFIRNSVSSELASLAMEEVDEYRLLVPDGAAPDDPAFERVARELSMRHGGQPMAFELWTPDGRQRLGRYGDDIDSGATSPKPLPTDRTAALPGHLRWRSTRLPDDRIVALLLDGAPIVQRERRYEATAALLVLLALVSSLIVAEVFSRRLSRMLQEVADRVRSSRPQSGPRRHRTQRPARGNSSRIRCAPRHVGASAGRF